MFCIRYLLFSFTLVFVIFGTLLMYTGFSGFVSLNKYELVIENGPDAATIALLVVGFAIFVTAFFGCCGACTGNACMLRTFGFILSVLLIVLFISIGFIYGFRNTIHDQMLRGIDEAIVKYNETDNDSAIKKVIDDIQQSFHCCGANGPENWQNNTQFVNTDNLPKSCCSKDLDFINKSEVCTTSSQYHYKDGCVDSMTNQLKSSFDQLVYVGIGVILIQIIAIVFSCMLANKRGDYAYV